MFASLLVTLREGFEAALIVAVVLAYLRQIGALERARSVWFGVGAAVAVSAAGGAALFGLAFLAVVREGLETALFLFAAAGETQPLPAVIGALAGLAVAVALGWLVYRGGRRLPLRTLFTVTNLVLVAFGVYLVWKGVGELGEAVGGEVFEVLGPIAAVVYGVAAFVLLRRSRRGTDGSDGVRVQGTAA